MPRRERMTYEERMEFHAAVELSLQASSPSGEPASRRDRNAARLSTSKSRPNKKPPPPPPAEQPWEVTRAITLKGAKLWWSIKKSIKKVENRHFRMRAGW